MPKIEVNLDEVKDYVEPGWYIAQIVGAEVKQSKKQDGGKYINWRLQINEPDSEFHKQSIFNITSLKPNALPMLKTFLEAAGIAWDPDGFTTEECIGAELEIKVDVEEYEGKMQNRVTKVRPL